MEKIDPKGKIMNNRKKLTSSDIAQIEREITESQHWIVRVFLGWKAPAIAVLLGLIGLAANIVKQHGGLTQFSTTAVNMVSITCLLILIYGLIGLIYHDWSWGKEKQ
ncbi:hypothetical protein F0267_00505 [Vibrio coralliilyticus]|uniref:Uncharacterized protein n=1 Tax=Vibrio coralliilyticus TaxID=190893 RepID=A0AAN0SKF1_9VIBR|nr:hypothetical protein [Vibrio coralliilyticus]AIW22603.1 hypothetical protein IX92_26435 [Vibrio coralliilyticus]NOH36700.1 hypothetical protein [Vibrio coralliilyticus]